MKKRILSVFAVLAIFIAMFPLTTFAADVRDKGSCGPNAKWSLSTDGVLTVSGTGEMTSNPYHEKYSQEITSVVIENGITVICDHAFYQCYNIQSVSLPSGLTEIKDWAFMQCINLTSVDFPDTLKKIGDAAFWNSGLEIVYVPDSVETIESDAFADCKSLSGIYTGRNIDTISFLMLRENPALKHVYIGKKVTTIEASAFNLSDNIETIYYEGSKEEWNKITIGSNNAPLKNVHIEFNCTEHSYSVYKPSTYDPETHLTYSITAGKVKIEYVDATLQGDLVIPEYIDGCKVTYIDGYGISWMPDVTSVSIPAGVTEITDPFLIDRPYYVDEDNQYYSSEDGNLFNKDKTELLRYISTNYEHEYTVPDTVTKIHESAFYRLYTTLKVNIPKSVTDVGKFAFNGAMHLYWINVDETNPVYSSENGVLFNKDKTELLRFPSLRAGAYHWAGFDDEGADTNIDSYDIPDGIVRIGDGAFAYCKELKYVTVPDSVENIGESAFVECSILENINLPDNLKSIERHAFQQTALTSVTIPDSVTNLGDRAFAWCKNLSEIDISNNLENIGEMAFEGTAYYQDESNWENNALYIGNNLIKVKDGQDITELKVKDGTNCIAACAFFDVGKIILPDSLTAISEYAFVYATISEIEIPDGVTRIGDYAFLRCYSLEKVYIPATVTSIGTGVFALCDRLSQLNYAGTAEVWAKIEIADEENENLHNTELIFNANPDNIQTPTEPDTQEPDTQEPDTQEPDTQEPDTQEPDTQKPDTQEPDTQEPDTQEPDTQEPDTQKPDTQEPDTQEPDTQEPDTQEPDTQEPDTNKPSGETDLTPKENSNITTDNDTKTVTVSEKTDCISLKNQFENDVKILDAKGNILESNDFIGTGCTIQALDSDSVYTIIIMYDVDGNGKITASDARLALRAAANLEALQGVYAEAADVNNDGKITASDARKILRKAAGLE